MAASLLLLQWLIHSLLPLLHLLLPLATALLLSTECCKSGSTTTNRDIGSEKTPSEIDKPADPPLPQENLADKWRLSGKQENDDEKTDLDSLKEGDNPLATSHMRNQKKKGNKSIIQSVRNAFGAGGGNPKSVRPGVAQSSRAKPDPNMSVYQGAQPGDNGQPKSQWAAPGGNPTDHSPFGDDKDKKKDPNKTQKDKKQQTEKNRSCYM